MPIADLPIAVKFQILLGAKKIMAVLISYELYVTNLSDKFRKILFSIFAKGDEIHGLYFNK
jgi:hypothetical protein